MNLQTFSLKEHVYGLHKHEIILQTFLLHLQLFWVMPTSAHRRQSLIISRNMLFCFENVIPIQHLLQQQLELVVMVQRHRQTAMISVDKYTAYVHKVLHKTGGKPTCDSIYFSLPPPTFCLCFYINNISNLGMKTT